MKCPKCGYELEEDEEEYDVAKFWDKELVRLEGNPDLDLHGHKN